MGNKCSHISKNHLLILEIIGEEKTKLIAERLGKIKISFYEFIYHFKKIKIIESYKSGKPIGKIARENGVHISTVYRIVKKK
jgi:hypothetical protein